MNVTKVTRGILKTVNNDEFQGQYMAHYVSKVLQKHLLLKRTWLMEIIQGLLLKNVGELGIGCVNHLNMM